MRYRRPLQWVLGLMCLVLFVGLLIPSCQTIHWVGIKDLEITFLVTDARTGRPVPDAVIHIQDESDFGRAKHAVKEFDLKTDSNGMVLVLRKQCTTAGQSSGCIDSWGLYLPDWLYSVSVSGYVDTEPVWLMENHEHRRIKRPARDQLARVTIWIQMQPKQ